MQVILISGKAQHGKDTSANYLKAVLTRHGKKVLITHYGDVLKHICKQFFDWDGVKDEQGRAMLQFVGTDTIRKADPDYFVTFTQTLLNFFPDAWDYVLIPDCRFPNEVDMIPGIHLRVVRENFESPLTPEQQMHKSEVALDDHPYDHLIVNDGSLLKLHHTLEVFAISQGWVEDTRYCSGQPVSRDFCEGSCLGDECPYLSCLKTRKDG